MEPFTVMVLSGLYSVKSCRLDTRASGGGGEGEVNSATRTNKEREPSYDDIVILVPVSCSIFFRLRPSFPINLPTKLLCTSIFSGISSVLRETDEVTRLTSSPLARLAGAAPTHNFVSMASFCMMSMMVLQALEEPSGVE